MCVYLCSMKNLLFPFLDCCLRADCQAKSNEHRATYTLNIQRHWSLSASLEREHRYLIFCLVFVPKHVKEHHKWQVSCPYYTEELQVIYLLCSHFISTNIQMRQRWTSWVFTNMHCSVFLTNKVYLSLYKYM